MTLAEFENLVVQDNHSRYELNEGELITLSPTARPHAKRLMRLIRYLDQHLSKETYDILPGELGFVLATEPKPTVRAADLAVMYHEEESQSGFVKDPPLLVIEVVSPGNDSVDLETKRLQYLEAGAQEVWIVYDKTQTIHVFQKAGSHSFVCNRQGTFRSTLGFVVAAGELFA